MPLFERGLSSLAPGSSIEGRRFRPNLVVATPTAGYVEDAWVGRLLRALSFAIINELPLPNGRRADVVSVLVSQLDPTESTGQYARYTLKANGVTQPGG